MASGGLSYGLRLPSFAQCPRFRLKRTRMGTSPGLAASTVLDVP